MGPSRYKDRFLSIVRGISHRDETVLPNPTEPITYTETGTDKRCLDVCAELSGVSSDDPLPVENAGDVNGFFLESTLSVPDLLENTIITHVVPAATTFRLNNVYCSTSIDGVCRIKNNGTLIGVIRVGAGNKNGIFQFQPNRDDITSGDTLTVTFQSATITGVDVDVFVQARQFT